MSTIVKLYLNCVESKNKETFQKKIEKRQVIEMNFPELNNRQIKEIKSWLQADDNETITFDSGYFIYGENIKTLDNGKWLDSMVISFYMKMLMKRSEANPETMPKVFAFGTEFWTEYEWNHYEHESVEFLTNDEDIFTYDLIIVPVHENGDHWTLAVISIDEEISVTYYNSMGYENDNLLTQLIEYLNEEHFHRNGERLDNTIQLNYQLLQQENGFDCGAIICSIAEFLSRNVFIESQLFSEENMAHFRQAMIYEICSGRMLSR